MINDNMEIDDRFAKEHIRKWIRAWNDHNVREVISLYSRVYHSLVLKLNQFILTEIRRQ